VITFSKGYALSTSLNQSHINLSCTPLQWQPTHMTMLETWKAAKNHQRSNWSVKGPLAAMSMIGASHHYLSSIVPSPIPLLWVYFLSLLVRSTASHLFKLGSTLIKRTGIFLISIYGVKARGVATPNVLVGVLIFFGGVCQFISGIMEFISGNTVSLPSPSP
jgi:hypothetical protein